MTPTQVIEQAIEALEDSVEFVAADYVNNWRHGIPSRASQLNALKESLERHKGSITNLRALLEEMNKQEPVARYFQQYQGQPIEEVDEAEYNKTPEDSRFKLYTAPQPASVPDGMVLVPVEPTEEMIRKGWGITHSAYMDRDKANPRDIWIAMIAAALKEAT